MVNLTAWELGKQRNGIIVWGCGLGIYLALILWLAPDLAPQFATVDLAQNDIYRVLGIGENINTADKLLAVYIPFIGLLVSVYSVLVSSHALAGEKQDGTLETLLTLPLSRPMIVIAKAIALELSILLILTLSFIIALIPVLLSNNDVISLKKLALACVEPIALAMLMGMLTLWLSAFVSRRGHALGIGLLILLASYLLNNLTNNALPIHPFYHYSGGSILTEPFPTMSFVGLLLVAALFFWLALFTFMRRNFMGGQTNNFP